MSIRKIIYAIFLSVIVLFLFAQEANDCTGAIPITGNEVIAYNPKGIGIDDFAPFGNFLPDCDFTESSSLWLKMKIAKTGTLTFEISPNNGQDDYDFAFYKTSQLAPNACMNLGRSIRCSSTNPQLAGVSALTGLRDNEVDISEGPAELGNGYVKSLQVQKGDYYYVFINNFSNKDGFSLTFGGTATLDSSITCNLGIDINKNSCNRQFDITDLIKEIKNDDNTLSVELFKTLSDTQNHILNNQIRGESHTISSNSEMLYARIVNNSGCVDFKTVTLTTIHTLAPIAPSQSYCIGNTRLPLNVISPDITKYIYTWYNEKGTKINEGAQLIYTSLDNPSITSGTFTVKAEDKITGCISPATTVELIEEPQPTLSASVNNPILFYGQTLELYSNPSSASAYTLSWKGPNDFQSQQENPFIKAVQVQDSGTYKLILNNNSDCSAVSEVNIQKVYPDVETILGEDVVSCGKGEPFTFSYPKVSDFSYHWIGSKGFNSRQNQITVTDAGVYTLTVTAPDGNQSVGSAAIKASDLRVEKVNSCIDQTLVIPSGGRPPYEYSLDGVTFQSSPIFKGDFRRAHTLYVRDSNGCEVREEVRGFKFDLYGAFSPNRDGISDRWDLSDLSGCVRVRVKIFDRYGRYVHQMGLKNLSWDGRVKRKALPLGTYWYVIEFNDGVTPTLKGNVTIKRRKD